MRGGVTVALVLLGLLAAVSPAGADSGTSMTVTASPHTAGAQGVRLTLTLHYMMQCNYPGAGPVVVTFPARIKLPKQFPSGAVTLGGKPVAANVDERQLTVTVAPHKGMLCSLMSPGSLTLAFAPSAKLANPARAGSYRFTATHGKHAFSARLSIKPAG